MGVSYPTDVWDGDSASRDSDNAPKKAPDWRDWDRAFTEVVATQNRVNDNAGGVDDDAIDSVGTLATKTGLSVVETGDGAIHKTVITMDEMQVVSTDGAAPGADGAWGTQQLYTFPEGHINVLNKHIVFPLAGLEAVTGGGTGFSTTADFEIGVGTVAAAQDTQFDLNGGDEEDVVAAIVCALTAKTSDAIESLANGTAATVDGSTAALEYHLNFRTVDNADHGTTADVLLVSGTFTFVWTCLGND
ncbi:MAG: hypothetical protein V3V68_04905 [Nitrosomonadaceae bacterium]